MIASTQSLKKQIIRCARCEPHLAKGARPVVQFDAASRILIAGQAPSKKVHESGIPFDDASGDRLREWLGVSKESFYDDKNFAILPMGFCYPGTGKSGDLPPRQVCADEWRTTLLNTLNHIQLTLVIGKYAMAYHLPAETGRVTEIVTNWRQFFPSIIPLPHPSPRNNIWLKRNPWFENDVLPSVRAQVSLVLA